MDGFEYGSRLACRAAAQVGGEDCAGQSYSQNHPKIPGSSHNAGSNSLPVTRSGSHQCAGVRGYECPGAEACDSQTEYDL